VTVGFGFLVALDRWPLDLRAKAILVPIAQAVVAIPFVVRAVVPALRSIDSRLRDAAAVLGASPRRVWREVDLPITLRAFSVGFGPDHAMYIGDDGFPVFDPEQHVVGDPNPDWTGSLTSNLNLWGKWNFSALLDYRSGGQIFNGPMEIPGGEYALNAMDPQGASFGLVGPRK